MAELLIGCGASRTKKITIAGRSQWCDLTTLDISESAKPDVLWDLERLPLPFEDDRFDEVHAYCVLEHIGRQGDWRAFLDQFSELWRILKPDGYLAGICPRPDSPWAWGDPGHTRIIAPESFSYLDQSMYGGDNAMTDYREHYAADFRLMRSQPVGAHLHGFVLQAMKPARV